MVRVDEPGEEDLSDWNAKYKPRALQLALYWPMEINWIVTLKKNNLRVLKCKCDTWILSKGNLCNP